MRNDWCAVTVHRRRRWSLLFKFFVLVFVTVVGIFVLIVVRVFPSRRYIASTRSEVSVLVVEVWQRFWSVGVQSKV
jgi:uncharacterized membrane protein YqjE